MTIVWPETLPQRVSVDGYSRGAADGRLFQSMEKGPPKVRLRTAAAVRPMQASILVEADQLAAFENFWIGDLSRGVKPFYMPDNVFDAQELSAEPTDLGPLLTEDDSPILLDSFWFVQFGEEAYQVSAVGPTLFRVAFSFLVLP